MEEQLTTPTRPSDAKIELDRQFSLFANLFAIASLHLVWRRFDFTFAEPFAVGIHVVIAVTAFATMFRSKWVMPFVALCCAQFTHGLIQLPYGSSADTLWIFFSAAVLISAASGWLTQRNNLRAIGLYRGFAPSIRMMLVLALIATGVARLNWAFLDIGTSPINATLTQLWGDQPAPSWVVYSAMSLLLIVECCMGLSLLIPSLRRFAVGIGTSYFAWQALLGLGQARELLPLFIVGFYLFVSVETIGRVGMNMGSWLPLRVARSTILPVATGLVTVVAIMLVFDKTKPESFEYSQRLVTSYFAILVGIWLAALLFALIDARPRLTWVSLMARNPLHYGLLALFLAALCSPYVGWGTYGRFAEETGLTTLEERNNHLLIPQFDFAGNRNDLVEIIAADDPFLQSLAADKIRIPCSELAKQVDKLEVLNLTFRLGGEQLHCDSTADFREIWGVNPWIARKLIGFHLVHQIDYEKVMTPRQVAQP